MNEEDGPGDLGDERVNVGAHGNELGHMNKIPRNTKIIMKMIKIKEESKGFAKKRKRGVNFLS